MGCNIYLSSIMHILPTTSLNKNSLLDADALLSCLGLHLPSLRHLSLLVHTQIDIFPNIFFSLDNYFRATRAIPIPVC